MNTTTTRLLTQVGTGTAIMALTAGTALAWHPNGKITKGVTNLSSGNAAVMAADTAATAVSAKPGDLLKYTIVVKDDTTDTHPYQDMGDTKLVDTLPAGVELVSGKTTDTIGLVKAQKSVTRELTVRVKADVKDGQILDNKACFTGEATNYEAGRHQEGCDHAIAKVTVPKATPAPTPIPTPAATPKPTPVIKGETLSAATVATPTILPVTGSSAATATLGLTAMVSTGFAYLRSRKNR